MSAADVVAALAAPLQQAAAEARVAASAAAEARSLAARANCLPQDASAADRGAFVQGLRNRLVLKYAGVDFEYYARGDAVYRGPLSQAPGGGG